MFIYNVFIRTNIHDGSPGSAAGVGPGVRSPTAPVQSGFPLTTFVSPCDPVAAAHLWDGSTCSSCIEFSHEVYSAGIQWYLLGM